MFLLIIILMIFPLECLLLLFLTLIATPIIAGTIVLTVKLCVEIIMITATGMYISSENVPKCSVFTVFNSLLLIIGTIIRSGVKVFVPPILSVIILCAGCIYASTRKKPVLKVLLFIAAEILSFLSLSIFL